VGQQLVVHITEILGVGAKHHRPLQTCWLNCSVSPVRNQTAPHVDHGPKCIHPRKFAHRIEQHDRVVGRVGRSRLAQGLLKGVSGGNAEGDVVGMLGTGFAA